jgi:hypothetical protein
MLILQLSLIPNSRSLSGTGRSLKVGRKRSESFAHQEHVRDIFLTVRTLFIMILFPQTWRINSITNGRLCNVRKRIRQKRSGHWRKEDRFVHYGQAQCRNFSPLKDMAVVPHSLIRLIRPPVISSSFRTRNRCCKGAVSGISLKIMNNRWPP